MPEKRMRSVFPESLAFLLLLLCTLLFSGLTRGQVSEGETLDRVMAVVGGEVVLKSDIEQQKSQSNKKMSQKMGNIGGNSDCRIIERLMYRKLLLHQAKVDSVTVKESRVDAEMDRRIRFFSQQIGGREKLEEFYGMSIERIKEKFRPGIKERLRVQKMRKQITGDISVTPSEVKSYYKGLPEDSIPLIDASVHFAHIVIKPELRDRAIRRTRKKLERYRKRIKSGEKSFSVLATLYSDDPTSAGNGGDLGYIERGEMPQKFEGAVFSLDSGALSKVVRTDKGFHLAQLLDKRGQKVKVRQILLKPEVGSQEVERVKKKLDSIAKLIRLRDTLSFKEAARKFSDDKKTRRSGGRVMNRRSGSTSFKMDQLDPKVTFAVENLDVGQISDPIPHSTDEGKAYRIIKLLEHTKPHKATIQGDYRFLQKRAKQQKEDRVMKEWVNKRIRDTYIRVNKGYRSCSFQHDWLKGNQQ
ncbi:MAG: peptidylprolyl isomerase [Flavobacteriales bacterium]